MAPENLQPIKVSYDDINCLVEKACSEVIKDEYFPDAIVGISSGGLTPARMAKFFLNKDFPCCDIPVYVIGLSSYGSRKNSLPDIVMRQKLDSELEEKIAGSKILMVDEVDDTRRTLEKASDYLLSLNISELRILVVHSKDKEKDGSIPENVRLYYGKKTPDCWIEYPWG
ncbi:MAG: phosphoribosyltransferase family protein [Candidatus Woesearchaeota archaeon]|nr:phosphoribosyltransferase family protein [Candidatus Woesearchaeota archaeon]